MSFTKKQLKAINAKLKVIEGEATQHRVEVIVRSVMLPAANDLRVRAVLNGLLAP